MSKAEANRGTHRGGERDNQFDDKAVEIAQFIEQHGETILLKEVAECSRYSYGIVHNRVTELALAGEVYTIKGGDGLVIIPPSVFDELAIEPPAANGKNCEARDGSLASDGEPDHLTKTQPHGHDLDARSEREWFCTECGARVTVSADGEREYGHGKACCHRIPRQNVRGAPNA